MTKICTASICKLPFYTKNQTARLKHKIEIYKTIILKSLFKPNNITKHEGPPSFGDWRGSSLVKTKSKFEPEHLPSPTLLLLVPPDLLLFPDDPIEVSPRFLRHRTNPSEKKKDPCVANSMPRVGILLSRSNWWATWKPSLIHYPPSSPVQILPPPLQFLLLRTGLWRPLQRHRRWWARELRLN